LRGRYPRYGFLTLGLLASGSYNKRNPKKGIESGMGFRRDEINLINGSVCYNKRNPKKGIESTSWADVALEHLHDFLLQQKKSQKGN
jgi:hypothetical protein